MRDSMFSSPASLALFQEDVLQLLRAHYMLPNGTVIEGQSFSHLQQCLRMHHSGRRWKLGGGYGGFCDALAEAGFKVVRARTMRYTRKNEFKPYAECQVVTL